MLDNLPVLSQVTDFENPEETHFERGFPVGFVPTADEGIDGVFVYNHIEFIIEYNVPDPTSESARIVGFQAEPFSIKHEPVAAWNDDNPPQLRTCRQGHPVSHSMAPQAVENDVPIIYTYGVRWHEVDLPWAQRWDSYLASSSNVDVHWFSVANSMLIVLFLSGMIAMIMVRALYRDIAKYNEGLDEDETGWKLVHADVFRPPVGFFGPMFLSVFVGSGVQIVMMASTVMVFAMLGFLSPANRGGLLTALLLLFVFMGSAAGYVSARVYKMFRGKAWKRNTLLTALAFPSSVFGTVFIVNFFVWDAGSTSAIPIGTFFAILVLWFGISVPLVFLGSYFGFKRDAVQPPVRVNQIPRHVPPQPWYLSAAPSILIGGVLPFGTVFIELFFIMSSIWLTDVYYMFGFLFVMGSILTITCAEIAIVMTYFQLCSEDYNWWWRSFLTPGAAAVYLLLYSIMYYVTQMGEADLFVTGVVYFSYMGAIAWAFFLFSGAIGFLASLWFTRQIYSSIKVD